MNSITQAFIEEHIDADVSTLALKKAPQNVDLQFALKQIAARQVLKTKVPSWASNSHLEFGAHLALEQCSSERTARYKAMLVRGGTLVDLTGGLGVDCYFLAQNFTQTIYIEQQEELCRLAQHNFSVLNANISVEQDSAETYLEQMPEVDVIFIDPARRDNLGRKTVALADCTPNVEELCSLLLNKAKNVLIKVSPMLDITLSVNALSHVKEVHVVALENECKELLLLLERGFEGDPELVCANLQRKSKPFLRFSLKNEQYTSATVAEAPKRYLYEPNAALLKAGLFKTISAYYHIDKLAVNTHLYTSEELFTEFDGRVFEVIAWAPFNKAVSRTLLADVSQANLSVRNFPLSVAELRQKLHLKEGGETYLFATTLNNGQKIIVRCQKII